MNIWYLYLLWLVEVVLFFFVRLLPVWRSRHSGCDAYYFLLTAEIFRHQRHIPITLPPYYLADIDEQWYPPGFSVFLGLLPEKILQTYYWSINYLIDLSNMLLLDGFLWVIGVHIPGILWANVIYIFTPTLTIGYAGLTSRSLGNLLFTGFMLALFQAMHEPVWGLVAFFLWGLILLTHKLTMQLGLFTSIILALAFHSWIPILVVWGGIPLTIIFTNGYYYKILKSHWDIVSFWHKNLSFIMAHQVRDSPIYGEPGRSAKHYTLRSDFLQRMKKLLAHSPFIFLTSVQMPWLWNLAVSHTLPSQLAGILKPIIFSEERLLFLICWALSTILWSIITSFVPFFRALGEGEKYLKYSVFPIAALSIVIPPPVVVGCLISSIVTLMMWLRSRSKRNLDKKNSDLEELLHWVNKHKEVEHIGCLSVRLADILVYFCRRSVLWGTHHYWFNEKIQDFYPILRKDIPTLTREYHLKYWIIDTEYTDLHTIHFSLLVPRKTFGKYSVFTADDILMNIGETFSPEQRNRLHSA